MTTLYGEILTNFLARGVGYIVEGVVQNIKHP